MESGNKETQEVPVTTPASTDAVASTNRKYTPYLNTPHANAVRHCRRLVGFQSNGFAGDYLAININTMISMCHCVYRIAYGYLGGRKFF